MCSPRNVYKIELFSNCSVIKCVRINFAFNLCILEMPLYTGVATSYHLNMYHFAWVDQREK